MSKKTDFLVAALVLAGAGIVGGVSVLVGQTVVQEHKTCSYFLLPECAKICRSSDVAQCQACLANAHIDIKNMENCAALPVDVTGSDIALLRPDETGKAPYSCYYGVFGDGKSVVICQPVPRKTGRDATVVFECVKQCTAAQAKNGGICKRIGKLPDGSNCFLREF